MRIVLLRLTGSSSAPGQTSKKLRTPHSQPQVVLQQIPNASPLNNNAVASTSTGVYPHANSAHLEDESSSESKDDISKVNEIK